MESKLIGYIAQSQSTILALNCTKNPRKALLEKLGATRADKIYRDTKEGSIHVGYIVNGMWFDIFEIHKWNK